MKVGRNCILLFISHRQARVYQHLLTYLVTDVIINRMRRQMVQRTRYYVYFCLRPAELWSSGVCNAILHFEKPSKAERQVDGDLRSTFVRLSPTKEIGEMNVQTGLEITFSFVV